MDPYSILDIPRDATTDQIRRAHRKLAKEWHPDLNPSPNAKAKFTEIQQAYESLVYGKPFRPSPRPNTQPQQPRQYAYTPRTDPPKQQSHAPMAERLKKRQAAATKKQKANAEVYAKRARARQRYTSDLQANRDQSSQTLTSLRITSVKLIAQAEQSAASRLATARNEYARLVKSINDEKDKAVQMANAVRDKKVTEVLRAKTQRERTLDAQIADSDRVHLAELHRIERQFQADLAAAG
jgi:hypothetical protein